MYLLALRVIKFLILSILLFSQAVFASHTRLKIAPNFFNFETHEQRKVITILKKIEVLLNTKEFKQKVLSHEYQGEKTFLENQNFTNEEIWEKFKEAREELNSRPDFTINLHLEMYHQDNNVLGYTYPNVKKIYLNRKFYSKMSDAQIAGNLIHEWTHKLGFDHDFDPTPGRNSTVPYAIGFIVENLYQKNFK